MRHTLKRYLEPRSQIYQTDLLEAEKNLQKITKAFLEQELVMEVECFTWDTDYYQCLPKEFTICSRAMVVADNSNFRGVMDLTST